LEYENLVLKLNFSDNRGIDIIRTKVKEFCRKKNKSTKFQIKVLVLDEADSLTESAQEALRRIMEKFSETSRFILICNFPSKIIEPVQSRCTIFIFKYPNFQELLNFIVKVFERKNQGYDLYTLESVIYFSDGDFRNILKEIEYFKNKKTKSLIIDEKNLIFILNTTIFPRFFCSCKNQNFYLAVNILLQLWNGGLSELDIINGLFRTTKNLFIIEDVKLVILNLLCEIRFKLTTIHCFKRLILYITKKIKIILK
jgi:DNA polymerase III delta prime subunit